MSDWSWQKVAPGANYNTLNTQLNGLPDYLRKQNIQAPAVPAVPAKTDDQATPNWLKWLASFNQGVTEGVPFAKTILNKLNVIPASQKKLMEESKKEKPGANILGNIAGGIGATGAVPMAKAAVGGVGLAAKGFLPSLARGAVNAASFAVPQAVSQGVETGKWGKAALTGLTGIGTGAVFNATGEAIGPLISRGWKAIRNWLNDATLKAGGVRGREMMKVLQEGIFGRRGYTPERAVALKEQIADSISKEKLYGKQILLDFFDDKGPLWKSVDKAWEAADDKVVNFKDAVMQHPDVMEWLTSPLKDPDTGKAYAEYAQATLDDIFAKAGSRKDLPATRELLWTTMKNGMKEGTNLGQIKSDVSGALRDAIDNKYIIPGMKEEYPALLALKKSLAWNEASIARSGSNSSTAPRMMLKQLLSGTSGTALGAGYGVTKWDPNDPKGSLARLGKAAAIGASATLGGNFLNRALSRGGTQLTGRLAGALRNVLPKELPAVFSNIGGRVAQVAGTKAAPAAVAALTGPQAPSAPAAAATPAEASVSQSEARAAPEAVQAAREKVNTAYSDRVMQALQTDWVNMFAGPFAQLGLKYEDFVRMVGEVTGGFDDPKKTARILFHDKAEREKFLGDYDAALRFGQQNVAGALDYYTPSGFAGWGRKSTAPDAEASYQNLIDYLSSVSPGGKSEAARARIEKLIQDIAKENIPQEQKKKKVEALLSSYGIDLAQLQGMGLYGAQNG